jgi:hypothetical protein
LLFCYFINSRLKAMMTMPKNLLISGMSRLVAQSGENIFRLLARGF